MGCINSAESRHYGRNSSGDQSYDCNNPKSGKRRRKKCDDETPNVSCSFLSEQCSHGHYNLDENAHFESSHSCNSGWQPLRSGNSISEACRNDCKVAKKIVQRRKGDKEAASELNNGNEKVQGAGCAVCGKMNKVDVTKWHSRLNTKKRKEKAECCCGGGTKNKLKLPFTGVRDTKSVCENNDLIGSKLAFANEDPSISPTMPNGTVTNILSGRSFYKTQFSKEHAQENGLILGKRMDATTKISDESSELLPTIDDGSTGSACSYSLAQSDSRNGPSVPTSKNIKLTDSQIEFFRLLEEKIERGPDLEA